MSESKFKITACGIVLAFALAASVFASQQSLWVDETTQLSGLTLGFGEQLRWLTGAAEPDLGVPPDRMPPLSYSAGSAWATLFGISENSLRAFSILALLLAAPAVFLAGRRLGGAGGDVALIAMLFSMPGLIIMAGEIRTYPIFLALSCWALWAYTGAVFSEKGQGRYTLWLMGFTILMSYAHYFGVVASCCMFAGLTLHRLMARQPVLPVIGAFIGVGVTWIGLAPFVMAAIGISGGTMPEPIGLSTAVAETVRFVIRLFADPVFLANRSAFFLVLMAIGLLALLGLTRAIVQGRRELAHVVAMAVPAITAIGGLGVLNIAISGFETLRPSYSIWLVPFLLGFLVLGLANSSWLRPVAIISITALVLGNVLANISLFRNLPLYTHGAGEWLAAQVVDKPGKTLLVHTTADRWGQSYFPTFYLQGDSLRQAVIEASEQSHFEFARMRVLPIEDFPAFVSTFDQSYEVRTVELSGQDRAKIANGQITCAEAIAQKTGQNPVPQNYCGMFGASFNAR